MTARPKRSALLAQYRVLVALILRDVKARWGGKSISFIIAIGWPLSHVLLLLLIYTGVGRPAPVGQDATLYFATGVLPMILFQYPSRLMMQCVQMNAALVNFPIVTILDLVIARAISEILIAFSVAIILAFLLFAFGFDVVPR